MELDAQNSAAENVDYLTAPRHSLAVENGCCSASRRNTISCA
jgi:hypothetical protein